MAEVPDTTLAYLAGFIDGDGFITITRSERRGAVYFGAQVGLGNTQRAPLDLAASIWGGKVSRYEPKNPLHRSQYQWQRVGKSAVDIVRMLFPYLVLKSDHALLVLEFAEHVENMAAEDPFPWFGPDFDAIAAMHRMREEMIGLNQSRSRSRRFAGRMGEPA